MAMTKENKIQSTLLETLESMMTLQRQQKELGHTLAKTYPNLVKRDSETSLTNADKELDVLLSSAVINKTGRFVLPAKGHWRQEVVLTRKPGLLIAKLLSVGFISLKITNCVVTQMIDIRFIPL